MNEERLSKRAAEGDERAFATIFKCYHQELYRFCLTIVRNPQDAQDALQNTMVKTLRALPGEKRHIGWTRSLSGAAHTEAIELLRRHRASVELEPELIASGGDPAEAAEMHQRLSVLRDDVPRREE